MKGIKWYLVIANNGLWVRIDGQRTFPQVRWSIFGANVPYLQSIWMFDLERKQDMIESLARLIEGRSPYGDDESVPRATSFVMSGDFRGFILGSWFEDVERWEAIYTQSDSWWDVNPPHRSQQGDVIGSPSLKRVLTQILRLVDARTKEEGR